MKHVNCNYCGAADTDLVNHGPDLLLNQPGDYRLVRCRQCGLIYQNPQLTLEELGNHYPQEYSPYKKDMRDEKSTIRRLDTQYGLSRRCKLLMKYTLQPGSILDIGCATGLFLNAMQQHGWQSTGVELSPYAAEYARQQFQLKVKTGTVEKANFPDNSFDVVTMWDVLEHVIDPKATLFEIARILKPGGLLALSLPNPTCPEAHIFGSSWVGWDRPRHLHLFTPIVLEKYLNMTGFHLEKIESLGGRLGLTLLSLELVLKARHIPEKKWRPWLRLIYTGPVRIATWPVYRLGELANKTTVMNVFARLPITHDD